MLSASRHKRSRTEVWRKYGRVTVKAGHDTANFTARTFKIGAENDVRVYASVNGQGTRTVLKVTP
jgi:hypothetical protein